MTRPHRTGNLLFATYLSFGACSLSWNLKKWPASLWHVQGLCALFAPGNRHAVVGTKEGSIQILDIGASAVLDTIAAHTGAVMPPSLVHFNISGLQAALLPSSA